MIRARSEASRQILSNFDFWREALLRAFSFALLSCFRQTVLVIFPVRVNLIKMTNQLCGIILNSCSNKWIVQSACVAKIPAVRDMFAHVVARSRIIIIYLCLGYVAHVALRWSINVSTFLLRHLLLFLNYYKSFFCSINQKMWQIFSSRNILKEETRVIKFLTSS